MQITIQTMKKRDTLLSILDFQQDSMSLFWKEQLFAAYPTLDKEKWLQVPFSLKQPYLTKSVSKIYDTLKKTLIEKKDLFKTRWQLYQEPINSIFSDIFDIDCHNIYNNVITEISLNPICPRYLKEQRFTVFYKYGPEQFLNTCIHELIHFVWFYKWQNHFKDNQTEYETPHLKWLLSEMVIDTLITNSDLKYFYKTLGNERPAYSYFYNMKIQNVFLLEKLQELFLQSQNIIEFMNTSYQYLIKNKNEIVKQIP